MSSGLTPVNLYAADTKPTCAMESGADASADADAG